MEIDVVSPDEPQQPPYGQAEPPPQKSHLVRNIVLGCVGAFILLIIIAAALGGGSTSSGSTNSSSSKSSSPDSSGPDNSSSNSSSTKSSRSADSAALAAPGTPVYDGRFKFTVIGMTCGASAASQVYPADGFETMPSGTTECIVNLQITNDKYSAQTFDEQAQYAYDSSGRRFSADDNAMFMAGEKDMAQVNPGVTITAPVAFNIPAGDSITKLELHDSIFSGGVDARP